jgi:hypothetical protein
MILPKFVVENDYMILGHVQYHKELAVDKEHSLGGGLFRFDEENNSYTFFGESKSYGKAKIEDIMICIDGDKVFTDKLMKNSIAKNHKFFYDTGTEIVELKPVDIND